MVETMTLNKEVKGSVPNIDINLLFLVNMYYYIQPPFYNSTSTG